MNLNVLLVRQTYGWMGRHSGYDQLCQALEKAYPANYRSIWREENAILPRGVGRVTWRMYRKIQGCASPSYNIQSAYAELRSLWQCFRRKADLIHLLYVERLLGFLPEWKDRFGFKLIGTAHQPAGWWRLRHPNPQILAGLDALIVPSRAQAVFFESILPGRVFFVPHGVDLEFFKPEGNSHQNRKNSKEPRCIIAGHWFRDFSILVSIVEKLLASSPVINFDVILPERERARAELYRLARHSQIHWHSNIPDESLLRLYRNATLLLLPLIDATANNAILEAMSCGLPIISNDVGGVRDYVRDSFADLYPVGDAAGMTKGVLRLLNDREERVRKGKEARRFAEENFGWEQVAHQSIQVYKQVISNE